MKLKKNYVLDTTPLIRRDISNISIIDQCKDISKCTKKSYSITYIQSLIDMMIRYVEIYVNSLMIEIIYINIDVQVNAYNYKFNQYTIQTYRTYYLNDLLPHVSYASPRPTCTHTM